MAIDDEDSADFQPAPGIGRRVRLIRERQGLSQAKFAELLGRSEGAVQQWETEKLALSQKAALHIALVCNVDASWIWEEAGSPPGWATPGREEPAAAVTAGELLARVEALERENAARHSILMSELALVRDDLEALKKPGQLPGSGRVEGSNP